MASRLALAFLASVHTLGVVIRLVLFVGLVVSLAAAQPVRADVLVSSIPRHLVCGDAIAPGIFAQPGTSGSRKVRIKAIDRRTGTVWWNKTATARTNWRYWYLTSGMNGRCRPTTIVYRLHGQSVRYRVSFRNEGV
jgi:hypothetical protein